MRPIGLSIRSEPFLASHLCLLFQKIWIKSVFVSLECKNCILFWGDSTVPCGKSNMFNLSFDWFRKFVWVTYCQVNGFIFVCVPYFHVTQGSCVISVLVDLVDTSTLYICVFHTLLSRYICVRYSQQVCEYVLHIAISVVVDRYARTRCDTL